MKNTVRKGFLFLVLALFVVGGVFAQRVGDTYQLDGQSYTVRSVSGDTVTLQRVAAGGFDGTWRGDTSGTIITISGTTAVYTSIGTRDALMQDASSKGRIAVGQWVFQNMRLENTGVMRVAVRNFQFNQNAPLINTNVNTYNNQFLHLSPDGRSLTLSTSAGNPPRIDVPGAGYTKIDFSYTRQ